jgi:hypothetical protein
LIYYAFLFLISLWLFGFFPTFLSLWIMVQWTIMYKLLCGHMFYFSWIYRSEITISCGTSLFSILRNCCFDFQCSCTFRSSASNVWKFQFQLGMVVRVWNSSYWGSGGRRMSVSPNVCQYSFLSVLIIALLGQVIRYLIAVWIWLFLIADSAKYHFSLCWLVVYFFLEISVFISFTHF